MNYQEIAGLIEEYSTSYNKLELVQRDETSPWFPVGDQKTGVFGEFYAYVYLEARLKTSVTMAPPVTKGYDIIAQGRKIQVKTVSAHSKSKRISPLDMEHEFDDLLMAYLGEDFKPKKTYLIPKKDIPPGYKSGTMTMRTSDSRRGSMIFELCEDVSVGFCQLVNRELH